jgi:hypothetical protein
MNTNLHQTPEFGKRCAGIETKGVKRGGIFYQGRLKANLALWAGEPDPDRMLILNRVGGGVITRLKNSDE